jgi:hypothetical protein
MWKDPIVEDIRKVRKRLEKEFGPNKDTFLKHIYSQEKRSQAKFVSRSPKKHLSQKAA